MASFPITLTTDDVAPAQALPTSGVALHQPTAAGPATEWGYVDEAMADW
jgi:hypothetical protein